MSAGEGEGETGSGGRIPAARIPGGTPSAARIRHPFGRWGRTVVLAVLVGMAAGLAAVVLELALHAATERLVGRFTYLGGAQTFVFRWEILLLPALGGLLSGLVVAAVAGPWPGHGTDQLVRAFHRQGGVLPLRSPLVKALAAVGVISCGGSAGPEGPIAGLGAAIGSSSGGALRLAPRERRVLLVAGAAAGVGAIFGTPLGGAIFAASILYRRPEFEGSALVSAFIAAPVGYSTYGVFHGLDHRLLENADRLAFASPTEIPVYVGLGLFCGATAIFFQQCMTRTERGFARLRALPAWLRPALGGLLTGALACALPQVMDGQYRFVQNALDGTFFPHGPGEAWLALAGWLALVALAKCVATAFTVGSGGAGGVLGPSVFIGGVVGAFVGALVEGTAPGFLPEPVRQGLVPVGMAGVLSAGMRTPLAAMVMAMEMTGSYGLIVPLMIVSMTAYLVGGRFGLIQDQVDSAADSPAHAGDAVIHLLESHRVRDVMDRCWPFRATRATPVAALFEALPPGPPPTVAVTEGERLVGVISLAEIRQWIDDPALAPGVIAADLMADQVTAVDPDDTLYDAVTLFQERGLDAAPVVAQGSDRFLGMLTRADVSAVVDGHLRDVRETVLREHSGLASIVEVNQLHALLQTLPEREAGSIARVKVDAALYGRSLADVDFRTTRGAVVLAIQTSDHRFLCPPDPRRKLESGDSLVMLVGTGRGA